MDDAILSRYGIDITSLIAGLIGCIIVQTLLPRKVALDASKIVLMTLGSVLFASVANPLAYAWVVHAHPDFILQGQERQVRAAAAALLGGFAQPILAMIRTAVRRFVLKKLDEG